MELQEFLDKFIDFNKRNLIKLIFISILVFYFAFLFFFNHYRIILQYSLESSWLFGIIVSLIFTIILVLSVDIIQVLYKMKMGR